MTESSPDPRLFRDALGTFATGVTIVTTVDPGGRDIGLTANSFNSVSLDPPMVLWSLAKSAASLPAFMTAPCFAVHVLAHDQDELSVRFAKRDVDRFENLAVRRGTGGIPLLDGCAARFECRTEFRYEGGDHVIFVGRVERFEHSTRKPLVFHGGQYAHAIKKSPEPAPSPDAEPDSSFSQDFLIYLLGRAHHQLFLEIRKELQARGLSEDQWFVLSILGVSDDRRLVDLDRMLAYTGKRVTYELLAGLAAADLVRLHGAYDPHMHVKLTDTGRRIVIELVSAAKAAEADSQRNLDAGEVHLLKRALRTIIRDTDPGLPVLMSPHSMD